MDVLDIGNNRIDDFARLTGIVGFKGLISLRVEGNPACREDPAISKTLAKEMPWLVEIDGVDSVVFGGGTETLNPDQITAAMRTANYSSSPQRKSRVMNNDNKTKGTSAVSTPASSSFTLSIASVMAEGQLTEKSHHTSSSSNLEGKDSTSKQKSKGADSDLRLDLATLAVAPKNPQSLSGIEYGLRRPSVRGGKHHGAHE